MTDAGRLRERIAIQRAAEVANGRGGYETSWPDLATVNAEVIGIGGREMVFGQTLQGISTFQITIRFREDLTAADRVVWKGRVLNIVAPPEDRDGGRQWTTLIADTSSPRS